MIFDKFVWFYSICSCSIFLFKKDLNKVWDNIYIEIDKMIKRLQKILRKVRKVRKNNKSNFNIFLIFIAIVLTWKSIANIVDLYFLPNHPLINNLICIALWMFILLVDDWKLLELEWELEWELELEKKLEKKLETELEKSQDKK